MVGDKAVRRLDLPFMALPVGVMPDSKVHTGLSAAYQGEDIKPLAPAHLKARRLANGFRVHWKRRARIGGDDWVSPELPLKEEAERYLIELVAGGEVHHSEEVTTSNFDLQEADLENWIATPLPSFDIIVHQISGQYGPGDSASLTITP